MRLILLCLALAAPLRAADETPELVLQIPHGGYLGALRFSSDGKTLAAGGQDDTIKLWDAATGLICRTLPKGDGPYPFPRTAQEVQSLRAGGPVLSSATGEISKTIIWMGGQLIHGTTLSPDDRFIARIREDTSPQEALTLTVSDAKSGKTLWHRAVNQLGGALFSTDGKWLVKFDRDRAGDGLHFWRVADGQPGAVLRSDGQLADFAFTADGKSLYTLVRKTDAKGEHPSMRVNFYSVPDGKLTGASAEMKETRPVDMMIVPPSRDGRIYLTRSRDGLFCCETLTGRVLWQQKVVPGTLQAAEISPAGNLLATAGYVWKKSADESSECVALELRDAHTGRVIWERDGSSYGWGAAGVTVLDDGRLQTRGADGWLLWDMTTGQPTALWRPPASPQTARDEPRKIGLSPDGKILIQTAPRDERARMSGSWELRDATTGELRATLKVPTGGFVGAGAHYFSPSGHYLAVTIWTDVEGNGSFRVFDAQTGKGLKGFASQGVSVSGVAFSRDEKTLASAHIDGTTNLYAVPSGELLGRLLGVKAKVNAVAFAPDGSSVVTAHADGIVRVWNVKTQSVARQWQAHRSAAPSPYDGGGRFSEGGVQALAFSPDDALLATCSGDGTAKIWDAQSSALKYTLAHDFAVKSLVFLPNGTLATGADDGALRLWNPQSGALRSTLRSLPGVNNWIAFTPTGFYDAAPGAEKFIAWRVGDKILPAAAFAEKFHRPDLLRAALK